MRMTIVILAMVFAAALPGCAPKKVKMISQGGTRDMLFPYGVYKHGVDLTMMKTDTAPEKHFEFTGVVKVNADQIQLVGLSYFGTTVFKVLEDRKTGEVKTEVFVEQMKKFESKIPEYYSTLRLFLIARLPLETKVKQLKWSKIDSRGFPIEAETVDFEKNATFRFRSYDLNLIPTEIMIEHPNFTVAVKVSDYDI